MQVNFGTMLDLEEPMTKEERVELKKALTDVLKGKASLNEVLFKTSQINNHVTLYSNEEYIMIENTKGGVASVTLKAKTFAKIAKELGYSRLKRSSKS